MNRIHEINMDEGYAQQIDGVHTGFEAGGNDAKVIQRELPQDVKTQRQFSIPETPRVESIESGPKHRAVSRSVLAKLALGRGKS